MKPFRVLFRVVHMVFFGLSFHYFTTFAVRTEKDDKVPIGAIFEQHTEELQEAFKHGVLQPVNNTHRDFQLYVDVINTADAFKLSRLTCNQFARGVISMLGAVSSDSFGTIHSYLNTFQMPFVTPWFPENVVPLTPGFSDFAVSIRPDYHRAVIDTIIHYNWRNIIYIYDSHDGLLRLQRLFQYLAPGKARFRLTHIIRVSTASEAVDFLRRIEYQDRWSKKYVILDSTTTLAKEILVLHVRDVYLGRRNYHYFLTGLVMDDDWKSNISEYSAINITGFRLLNHSRSFVQDFMALWKKSHISAKAALMFDAVHVIVDSILRLLHNQPELVKKVMQRNANSTAGPFLECHPRGSITPLEYGEKISRLIKQTDIEGLSGQLRFNEKGHRLNFSLQVVENNVEGEMIMVGVWFDYRGLVPVRPKLAPLDVSGEYNRNKTYIITTIEEPPYIMRHRPDAHVMDSEPYHGYCADLAAMLADKLDIKYEFRTVKDGKYGNENLRTVGGWDGMVGELVRREVDMAIGPLIATVERETVIDFSKPFLSFESKEARTDKPAEPSIFDFLRPLSWETWICIVCSLVAVSIVMFLVSRFSPQEWRIVAAANPESADQANEATAQPTVINKFSIWNSIWFTLGSFMQQGSDITPRSISGRIVGTVWWFVTMVVVCSYTANLTSHLILTQLVEPVHSYNKIATCPQDPTNKKIANYPDEIHGNDDGWIAFLMDKPGDHNSKTPCEMYVSSSDIGFKDFAVGFPKGSKLRHGVNLALMALKKDGELNKLMKKWFKKTECNSFSPKPGGTELTLGKVAGLFYILVAGLVIALVVALVEFFRYGRAEARRANVTLQAALRAKSRLPITPKSPPPRRQQEQEPEWSGNAFTGEYYSLAAQSGQEETALDGDYTQV